MIPRTEAEPFQHVIIDDAFCARLVCEADAQWPNDVWPFWTVAYDTLLERGKRACTDWQRMPGPCQLLLSQMLQFGVWSCFPDLAAAVPDGSLWGGGMHGMSSGGHLDLHEDSDHHPVTGWRRRANAILFLNREWQETWAGHLELWSADLTRCVKQITPKFNRLVIFEVGDKTYHGVPQIVDCPSEVRRKTLATFWFSAPIPGDEFRRSRANFVGPAGEHDPSKIKMREDRNQQKVYKPM